MKLHPRYWLRFRALLTFPGAAAAAKLLQLCLTLCDPIDGSPLGSSGILQARILEWGAMHPSNIENCIMGLYQFENKYLLVPSHFLP